MPPVVPVKPPSRYELYLREWDNCQRCGLCETRKKVVHCRGRLPAVILCVAEAPGSSENSLGVPLIGPAGKLFDHVLSRAVPEGVTYCLTNLVGCIPLNVEEGGKLSQPPDESVEACAPRLVEVFEMCQPKLVVRVGKLSQDWLDPKNKHSVKFPRPVPFVDILHPAAVLRSQPVSRGLLVQRMVVTLRNGIEEHVLGVDPFKDVPF